MNLAKTRLILCMDLSYFLPMLKHHNYHIPTHLVLSMGILLVLPLSPYNFQFIYFLIISYFVSIYIIRYKNNADSISTICVIPLCP